MHNLALHHLQKRKKICLKKDKYPHPNKFVRFFDILIYIVAILGPLITVPQVIKVWSGHNVAGVSIFSWVGYTFAATLWLIYGIIHKEKPIIVANAAGILMNIGVLSGILLYG